jgi:hypothetical protein
LSPSVARLALAFSSRNGVVFDADLADIVDAPQLDLDGFKSDGDELVAPVYRCKRCKAVGEEDRLLCRRAAGPRSCYLGTMS